MDIAEALAELGVREDTLTTEEKQFLDTQGYLPLRGMLTAEQIEAFRKRQEELLSEEGDQAGLEVHQEVGTDRLSDLINKGDMYHVAIKHPRLLAAIAHVLKGDLKLSSLNSRAALPGLGLQGLHADWGELETAGDFQVCNSVWLLDDFTPENGATRVVPGTHLQTKTPHQLLSDPSAPHPDQIILEGKAGDVVVFNAHLWHGGTLNRTDKPRRAMHGYFTRRHQAQQLDQQRYIRKQTWDTLSPAARVVLGVVEPEEWTR
jgi:ectoine hydroxylase-related dioxygenase (phytanoyl-CoA dioxygenase family)